MLQVTCQCGKHYKVPEHLAGKQLKCKVCQGPILIQAEPADDELQIQVEEIEEETSVIRGSAAILTAGAAPATRADPDLSSAAVPEHPFANYIKACVRSLIFIAEPGNFAPFIVVSILAMIQPWFGLAPCIGWFCKLIIEGWIVSFLFNTMINASSGSRKLPEITLMEGWVDGIFIPLFKYLASWLLVLWPAIIYTFLASSSLTGPASSSHVVLVVLVGCGVFLWPMSLLLVGLGGVNSFARPDLIFRTLLRTFVPYVLTCLLVTAAVALFFFVIFGASLSPGVQKHPMALQSVLELINIYFWVVAVRFVGLYYHHFKHRFAWDWG